MALRVRERNVGGYNSTVGRERGYHERGSASEGESERRKVTGAGADSREEILGCVEG